MKYAKKMDLIIIAVVAVLALVLWFMNRYFFEEKGAYAEIYHDSKLIYRIELSNATERKFSIPGEPNVVFQIYADRSIAFIESDCPDKVCSHMGKLEHANQFAACLPNKILLKIVSEEKNREGPDLIIE